ncbi:hypothetical protein JCM9279_004944 [Rhodotorula babjevae]
MVKWTQQLLSALDRIRLAHPDLSVAVIASAAVKTLERNFPEAAAITEAAVRAQLYDLAKGHTVLTPVKHDQLVTTNRANRRHRTGATAQKFEWTDLLILELMKAAGFVYHHQLEPRNAAIAKRVLERTGQVVDGDKLHGQLGIICRRTISQPARATTQRHIALLKSKGLPTTKREFEAKYLVTDGQSDEETGGDGNSKGGSGSGSASRKKKRSRVKRESSVDNEAGGEHGGGRRKRGRKAVKEEEE